MCKEAGVRMRLAVYPWPNQILNADIESIQVTHWREFAEKEEIDFINMFPGFFDLGEPHAVVEGYFVKGDFHWNNHGHQVAASIVLDAWIP